MTWSLQPGQPPATETRSGNNVNDNRNQEVRDDYRAALKPGWEELQLELEKNINNVNNIILDLGQMGIEVDDPTLGVVNFNSLRGIETVFLSYRLGERNVNHWHHLDENYECRRKMERELDIITQ